ncbi:hypothetical protein GCM10018793_42740 [Streptomyces sulfonofaciens]|uniref:ER-bound oxygenase mpaB/mpaB'/Rubber oxygenase catalytic domain-containing protein n=1 Tax=Streptomyces sulfonofaciens TaxID=68272 RepID=A0A919L2L1_9ACTN|nr:oxygenase MpaB family protein [Streptomyces sulfonofaciens]GHH82570.1 hypothetical protein GCM10018793_42740 [Streptomyces sulfonofaciens]
MSGHDRRSGGGAAARPTSGPAQPLPPPPGGILWESAGDIRTLLGLPAAFTLQVAHPAVGAGVDDHSAFRSDPWGRGERSLRSMLLWVYGGPAAAEEGRRLRVLHEDIRGTDAHGRPYHALEPTTYAWVHATGFPVARRTRRYLNRRPFTAAEERRLYAEWRQVGRVLGIREQDMPPSVAEFWPYYRAVVRGRLELTAVAAELLDPGAAVPPPDRGPRPVRCALRLLWPVLWPPAARFRRFLTLGLMPPDAREALGLPWTDRQERRLRRFGRLTAALVPLLPDRLRYLPQAHRARTGRSAPA